MTRTKSGVTVKARRMSDSANLPASAHVADAGFDLFSSEAQVIEPASWARVGTGIALEIPEGFEGQIRSRSGLASDYGVIVMNSPGTVDAGYRGEIMVLLLNLGKEAFHVKAGMRIAQLVITRCVGVNFVEEDRLSASDRGRSGFGSSGH
jgi:dUTP diphosphatase